MRVLALLLLTLFANAQVNVKDPAYGAKGDGKLYMDGAMPTGGSTPGVTFNCSVICYLSGFMMDAGPATVDVASPAASGVGNIVTAPSVTTTHASDTLLSAFSFASPFAVPTPPPSQVGFIQYSPSTSVGTFGGTQVIAAVGATPPVSTTQTCCVGSSSLQWSAASIALTGATVSGSESIAPTFGSAITFPALSASPGDMLVACIAYWGTATITPQPGWAVIVNGGISGGERVACYQILASGTPPANQLTSSTATFTNSDVGKLVCVQGAASDGSEMCASISGFVDQHNVLLSIANQNTMALSGREFVYATDDSAAFAVAIAAACGDTLVMPAGIYGLSQQLTPCSMNSIMMSGVGSTLPDYNNVTATPAVYGGASGTALWWLTKTMSGSGLSFGAGLGTVAAHVAAYRSSVNLRDFSVLAGVGGNHDGGCAACSGVYLNMTDPFRISGLVVAGWGKDGIVADTTWRGSIDSSMVTSNGRYGINVAASYAAISDWPQNLAITNTDVSWNQLDGVFGSLVGGLTMINDVVQWNDQSRTAGHYELNVNGNNGFVMDGSAHMTVLGTWFEAPRSSGAINQTAAIATSLIKGNIYVNGAINMEH